MNGLYGKNTHTWIPVLKALVGYPSEENSVSFAGANEISINFDAFLA
jgi:hypothetical protein